MLYNKKNRIEIKNMNSRNETVNKLTDRKRNFRIEKVILS